MHHLPEPPARALLGHLPLAFDLLKLLKQSQESLGEAFAWRMGPKYIAVFSSAHSNKEILLEQAEKLSAVDSFGPHSWILGQGLARLDGLSHKNLKKLLLPAFHRDILQSHSQFIYEASRTALERWQNLESCDVTSLSKALTLQIILKTLFNQNLDSLPSLRNDLTKFFASLMVEAKKPSSFLGFVNMLRLPGIANLRARLDRFLLELIKQPSPTNSSLAILKSARDSNGQALDAALIRDQLLTFIVAGHDTTAMALAWSIYALATYPQVRQNLKDELAFIEPSDSLRLRSLPYLNAFIKEVLRLHPPISIGIRRVLEPISISHFDIPKAANILYSPYLTHRSENYWEDAQSFKPQRFLDSNPSRYHYLPFGAGTHSCIGMNLALLELHIIVATLTKYSSWELLAEPTEKLSPTLEPSGLQVVFKNG